MLTTINKGMSASEHAIEITAVETRPCARGRARDDRRQVDVKGQEYETDCTRDKHTGRAIPGNSHRLCLRFSVQRVFLRLRPQCIPLRVSFTRFLSCTTVVPGGVVISQCENFRK